MLILARVIGGKHKPLKGAYVWMVGAVGIGPTASFLSGTRSTTELRTHDY